MLGIACFITSGLFYFSMDLYLYIYDPNWNGVFSEKESQIDRNLIFLLGASNVYSIDVDNISALLLLIPKMTHLILRFPNSIIPIGSSEFITLLLSYHLSLNQ